jgi:hypothetical protein
VQAIAIVEDNAAQYTTVINAWYTVAFWKKRSKPHHLRLCQPIKSVHHFAKSLGFVIHDRKPASSRLMAPESKPPRIFHSEPVCHPPAEHPVP